MYNFYFFFVIRIFLLTYNAKPVEYLKIIIIIKEDFAVNFPVSIKVRAVVTD